MNGKVIFGKPSVFVQVDKNKQICDLLSYENKETGKRIYPGILNDFRGRPLFTAWNELIEKIKTYGTNEEINK